MAIKTFWLALLLAPILLTRVKIPHNKAGHFSFHKFQLDSRKFGMVCPMGLWTRYHLGGDLNRLSSTKDKEYQLGLSYSKVLESNSNLI